MIKKLTNSIYFPIGLMLMALLVAGTATQVTGDENQQTTTLLEPIPDTPTAEEFSLINLDGEYEALSDFKGSYVLINFWATWCPPCIKEMPSLDRLQERLREDNFKVVAIHVGPSLAGISDFLTKVPLDLKILVDKDMSLATWGVTGLPTTYLVDPQGRLIYRAIGEREWDSEAMVDEIQQIMATQSKLVTLNPI